MTVHLSKDQRKLVIGVLKAVTFISRQYVNSPTLSFQTAKIIARLYGIHAQMIISHFVQNNRPGIFHHDNARPHTTRK